MPQRWMGRPMAGLPLLQPLCHALACTQTRHPKAALQPAVEAALSNETCGHWAPQKLNTQV